MPFPFSAILMLPYPRHFGHALSAMKVDLSPLQPHRLQTTFTFGYECLPRAMSSHPLSRPAPPARAGCARQLFSVRQCLFEFTDLFHCFGVGHPQAKLGSWRRRRDLHPRFVAPRFVSEDAALARLTAFRFDNPGGVFQIRDIITVSPDIAWRASAGEVLAARQFPNFMLLSSFENGAERFEEAVNFVPRVHLLHPLA